MAQALGGARSRRRHGRASAHRTAPQAPRQKGLGSWENNNNKRQQLLWAAPHSPSSHTQQPRACPRSHSLEAEAVGLRQAPEAGVRRTGREGALGSRPPHCGQDDPTLHEPGPLPATVHPCPWGVSLLCSVPTTGPSARRAPPSTPGSQPLGGAPTHRGCSQLSISAPAVPSAAGMLFPEWLPPSAPSGLCFPARPRWGAPASPPRSPFPSGAAPCAVQGSPSLFRGPHVTPAFPSHLATRARSAVPGT